MWNKGVPLGNKNVARLLWKENKRACPTYQVCIERESVPTVTATGSSSTIYLDYIVILSFCLTGVIIGCNLNVTGSWHDSRVAWPLYEKLRAQTPEGYYVVTDTAFPKGTKAIEGWIKSPMKSETRLPLDKAEREYIMQFNRQLLSFRQTAEWGNRGLQGSFGRLRLPLPIGDNSFRANILETIVRLYNFCTRQVGLNQITNVYMREK